MQPMKRKVATPPPGGGGGEVATPISHFCTTLLAAGFPCLPRGLPRPPWHLPKANSTHVIRTHLGRHGDGGVRRDPGRVG